LVVVGQKRGTKVVHMAEVKAAKSTLTLLKTRFCRYFLPIDSFLNEPNPFDRQKSKKVWLSHEKFITGKFAERVMRIFPALRSRNPDLIAQVGISPRMLVNDPSPENVRSILMGYQGYGDSPRWGLLGIVLLLEHIERLSETPEQFHSAMQGFFKYMRDRLSSYIRAYQIIENSDNPSKSGVTMADFIDSRSGVPLSHLVVLTDLFMLTMAYHPGFNPKTYASMADEWADIPNSYGQLVSPRLFDADGQVIGGNILETLRALRHEEQLDSNARSILESSRRIGAVPSIKAPPTEMPKSG